MTTATQTTTTGYIIPTGTKAIWRNDGPDLPITIAGLLDVIDGLPWYSTEEFTGGTPANQIVLDSLDQLEWLDDQGANFALPGGRTKGTDEDGRPTFEKGWQNKPHSFKQAIHHASRGGNVGILTGIHSDNIIAIDRDVNYPETIAMLGDLGKTVKIERDNAPGRGKFLYRIKGALPPTTVWKESPSDKHPACECLANKRHALAPPSEFNGGHYMLVDMHYGIKELTTAEIEHVWRLITGETFDKSQRKAAKTGDNDEHKDKIRDAWPTLKIFEHHGFANNGTEQDRGETRVLGNGGLLIADNGQWYIHGDEIGGDEFDAWAYCTEKRIIDRSDKEQFKRVKAAMATAAGLPVYVNGNSSAAQSLQGLPVNGHTAATATQPTEDLESRIEAAVLAAEATKTGGKLDHDKLESVFDLLAHVTDKDLRRKHRETLPARLRLDLKNYDGFMMAAIERRVEYEEAEEKDEAPDNTAEAKKQKQSATIYKMASALVEVFTAPDDEAYAFVPIEGRRECHKLRSKAFRNYLANAFYVRKDTIPSITAIQEALSLLEWDAQKERRDVYVRVAGLDGKIYIDLGNPDWQAVEVDTDGWRIVQIPPVAFRRSKASAQLPTPASGGSLDAIRDMLNIEPEDWPLVAVWMLSTFQPVGPYPILCVIGEQGSTKSTVVRTLKTLVDPSVAALRGQPDDIRDLMIAAANNWVLAYDNISYLSNDVSDALCRLATGGGYAKRSLYSDDEEFIIDATRPIVMNGITEIINRPDLLDRALVIELPVLSAEKRKSEKEYWKQIEESRPAMFGALLDALSFALGCLPHVELEQLPRMADFAKLGTAAQGLFDTGRKTFVDVYMTNRDQGTESIVEASPLTGLLKSLVLVSGEWEGTAAELLEKLELIATDRQKEAKTWPAAPNKLSSELKRLAPSLRQSGSVEIYHKRRQWRIKRVNPTADDKE